jgi:hypothetical protein
VSELPEKRAVVKIIGPAPGGEMKFGSGVLLNNFQQDGRLFVMTAAHLMDFDGDGQITPPEASNFGNTAQFGLGYEAPCAGGSPTQPILVQGATLVAGDAVLDLALFLLDASPDAVAAAQPYYAGWKDVGTGFEPVPQFLHLISHPCCDAKMVSGAENPQFFGAFLSLDRMECGGVELGSSGGPFFDTSDRRVIGVQKGFLAPDVEVPFETGITCAPEGQLKILVAPYNGFGQQFLGGVGSLGPLDPFG